MGWLIELIIAIAFWVTVIFLALAAFKIVF